MRKAPTSPAGAAAYRGGMRVLIADPSIPVRAALCGLLAAQRGISIAGAGSADEAVRCIALIQPQALIVERRLPGGSGLEVLGHARRALPGALLIVLTEHADEHARALCLEAGADHFLDKHSQFGEAVRLVHRRAGARTDATERQAA